MLNRYITFFIFLCVFISPLMGQDEAPQVLNLQLLENYKLAPPNDFEAYDTPNDNGGSLQIRWQLSANDNLWGKRGMVEKYVIGRRLVGEKEFDYISTTTYHSNSLFDNTVDNKSEYEYVVAAYPFKSIFSPIPWKTNVLVDQVEHMKLVSPWITLNPQGFLLSLVHNNYSHFINLDGYTSKLAKGSLWENFYSGPTLSGPAGLAPAWIRAQLLSPFAPVFGFFALSSVDDDPYKMMTLNKYLGRNMMSFSQVSEPVKAKKSWLNTSRINVLVLAIVLCFFILFYINQAKSGKELFIRKIAGLDAVEEAVGRATEMGKEIFYVPGTQDMENIQTIAGVIILGRVAKLTAELETKLEVPVSRSLVMVTAREIVKEAYMNAGRPEAFKEDMVHYLTDDQFGYAAAIDGKMVRQKPATIFYMGAFYAESLILAETGNSIGAIQIAGTAMPAQLPFFVAACDYTLIGEELFAASAYLSREPKLLGSLKGQDIGKAVLLVMLAVGVIVQTFGWFDFASLFSL